MKDLADNAHFKKDSDTVITEVIPIFPSVFESTNGVVVMDQNLIASFFLYLQKQNTDSRGCQPENRSKVNYYM